MAKSTKDIKITINYDLIQNCIVYSQLYLEQRIEHCKAVGRDYSQYEHDLEGINQFIKRL